MDKKYQGTIQSNLKLPSVYREFPNSDIFYEQIIQPTRSGFPNKFPDRVCESYLLSDNKPGIWYISLEKGFFIYCASVSYKDFSSPEVILDIQIRCYAYEDRAGFSRYASIATLGKIPVEDIGKPEALKLAAQARSIVKRASNLNNVKQVNKLIYSFDDFGKIFQ